MNNDDHHPRIALVTGASGEIGQAVCSRLEESGAVVFGTDVAGQDRERFIRGDLLDSGFPGRCIRQVVDEAGHLDLLINSAGICPRTRLPDIDVDEWNKVLHINLTAAFLFSQAAMDVMIPRRQGAIVNISSLAGKVGGIAVGAHYSAGKAALTCLTKTLARHGAPHGIRANAVAPGIIDTRMTRDAGKDEQDRLQASIPLGRFGQPDEVAQAVAFLASDSAAYITGATLDINGGLLMD